MLKLTSLLLFVVVFVTGTMNAQTLQKAPDKQTNLKKVFAGETAKIKSQSAMLDVRQMEKMQRQVPRSNWTKGQTWLVISLIALGVLAVVLALVTKRCIRREPRGCDFTQTDTPCRCLEYDE